MHGSRGFYRDDILCRDTRASVRWMLITQKDPLWMTLPRDLQRYVLNFFVFQAIRCQCGTYVSKNDAYFTAAYQIWKCKKDCRIVRMSLGLTIQKHDMDCICFQCRFNKELAYKGWFVLKV